jgi:hypothetical protein
MPECIGSGSNRWPTAAALLCALFVRTLSASEGGQPMVLVVDSRRFSGWEAWWANIYNDSHFNFALLTIAIIPLLGLAVARIAGLAMNRLGINLKSRVVTEH